jgi:hypothetical protein
MTYVDPGQPSAGRSFAPKVNAAGDTGGAKDE